MVKGRRIPKQCPYCGNSEVYALSLDDGSVCKCSKCQKTFLGISHQEIQMEDDIMSRQPRFFGSQVPPCSQQFFNKKPDIETRTY